MKYKITIKKDICIGCGVCEINSPDLFKVSEKESISEPLAEVEDANLEKGMMVARMCPVGAIELFDSEGKKVA
ncbi:hypothetical protein A3K34_03005 [candidate division WWE3 bacterium RIFOXYC1_FULL_40_10]|uniref:Ferredoxin n=1 Tax=candidate division WWE3 bacterium RIFOXYA2_FULL_46_9 TaxID=1802636 RepID=A0A1F4W094_UNCKA|nr:MAG: hypothetical protein A3K58_03005 [candidate division WWE3 bacterium RIFOXYB1_FULL_40_22]OGC61816.1 MAG: hypothetical protein A3K37_03005 [candidate division WWE3 bacterium RIFOXYA1_FULL_40_11]OGC62834.1 MAG: hypothetical protein A2264_04165 [candidate division WWE3 bacterium RIFOXYA2_FULL_46_9]OGC64288.1 MAG: hypothetical protein A2326_00420 [candidate division WWE3 bacterium RIFOXYB2_FULL_41_6]OGC66199.1 MAG: hypothetical protein A3K34_03005 [candidate division WWE3 bacterium RIFOXYC1_